MATDNSLSGKGKSIVELAVIVKSVTQRLNMLATGEDDAQRTTLEEEADLMGLLEATQELQYALKVPEAMMIEIAKGVRRHSMPQGIVTEFAR